MELLSPMMRKNSSVLTMSSREIADLVESRHDSVKRTIERLQDKGLIQLTPMVEVKNHLSQVVTEYQLIKRDTYVVVAQLSPEFTARLVDRERILAYEAVKRDLRERNASQEEYDRVTDQAIEELEI